MSIHCEHKAAKALGAATNALLVAACELGLAGRYTEALEANAAAKKANEECQAICDDVLARWWVQPIVWLQERLSR